MDENDCQNMYWVYRTIRQIDYNFQLMHLHGIVTNIDERMNQQITDIQDDDETYLTFKGQEAAKVQTSRNNNHTHLHRNSHTVVYHHRYSLASRGQSRGQTR